MSKLNNRYWLDWNTEKFFEGILRNVFFSTNSPLGTTIPTLSRREPCRQRLLSVKKQHKCIQPSIRIC